MAEMDSRGGVLGTDCGVHGLGECCLWLDTVAYAAGMLLPLGLSVYSVAQAFRHGDETGVISHKGTPRWLEKFLMDEDSHQ